MLSNLVSSHLSQFAGLNTKTHGEPPRPRTVSAHRLQLERLAFQYDRLFNDLSGLTVNWCKDWILTVKGGPANRNQALTAVTGFLTYLTDSDLWDRDKLESWQRFHEQQYSRQKRPRTDKYLRPDQLLKMIESVAATPNAAQSDRDIVFFSCVLFLVRPGEMVLLPRRQVQYCPAVEDQPASFRVTVPPEIAKDHAQHIAEIFEGAVLGEVNIFAAFERYVAWRDQHGPSDPESAFIIGIRSNQQDETGRRLWSKLFHRAAVNAKLKYVTPYWLRHTAGELGRGKINSREMQQLFGHTGEQTTEGYTHHQNGERLRIARLNLHTAILESVSEP